MTYENNPFEMGLDRLVAWDLPDEASISIAALRSGSATRASHAPDQRRRVRRRPVPGLNNVKWPALDGGGADRQGHVGDLLAAARQEHRLLLAPRRSLGEGTTVTVQTEWGEPPGDRRPDAVRGPGQDDPDLVSPPVP